MVKKNLLDGLFRVLSPGRATHRAIYSFLLFCGIACAAILMTANSASADGNHKTDKIDKSASVGLDIGVENFGKVTDFFYRGAQPKGEEYNQLAALGVKTIIDLRNDPKGFAKALAERAGLTYLNLPMSDKQYPTSDAATKFLTIVNDQTNWPVYVHCAGGRHRTGAMTAVYRMTVEGWDVDRAYEEMKEYDFYTRWGHKAMKDFVFNYYRDLMQKRREDESVATNKN